jgi:hypothetical protein
MSFPHLNLLYIVCKIIVAACDIFGVKWKDGAGGIQKLNLCCVLCFTCHCDRML